ncbi:MAG: dihydrodipicolinate synthase family protein [Victivallales bacterium]
MNIGRIKGIIPPLITPMDSEEKVDEKALRAIVRRAIDSGLHGIFVAGSGGEVMSLVQAERERAIRIATDEADGAVPVIAGAIDTSTGRVIDNVKRIEDIGCDAAVVTPAFYMRNSGQGEILRHFTEIAKRTSLPIIAYNVPGNTGGISMTPDIVAEIAGIDNVIGIKDSSGSWPVFQKLLSISEKKDFMVFQGLPEFAAVSLLGGAHGVTPLYALVFPELYIALYENCLKKNVDKAFELQKLANKINEVNSLAVAPMSVQKYVVSMFCPSNKRSALPVEPLTPEQEKKIQSFIKNIRKG